MEGGYNPQELRPCARHEKFPRGRAVSFATESGLAARKVDEVVQAKRSRHDGAKDGLVARVLTDQRAYFAIQGPQVALLQFGEIEPQLVREFAQHCS